jgi:hypothetical protein
MECRVKDFFGCGTGWYVTKKKSNKTIFVKNNTVTRRPWVAWPSRTFRGSSQENHTLRVQQAR